MSSAAQDIQIDISLQDPVWESVPDVMKIVEVAARTAVTMAPQPDRIKSKALEVSVLLANDDLLRVLNREYRGKDNPTNVLSFASLDSEDFFIGDVVGLGDVAVSFQTIDREAQDEGKFFKDHLTHLVVHGCLHLLGYDHKEEGQAIIMEAIEIRILEKLGVQNPYTDKIVMP